MKKTWLFVSLIALIVLTLARCPFNRWGLPSKIRNRPHRQPRLSLAQSPLPEEGR